MVEWLIADDYADIRFCLRMLLEEQGYTAIHEAATDDETVLALQASPHPLVILLDWQLPGGQQRAWNYLLAHPDVAQRHAVILMTGMARLDLTDLPRCAFFARIHKPAAVADLLALFQRAISAIYATVPVGSGGK